MIPKLTAETGGNVVRVHRVYTPQALAPGREIQLEKQASHYLGRVLRVGAGQEIVLFNGDGHDYAAEVLRPVRAAMALRVARRVAGVPEPTLSITVAQALSRGERMDQTLQKCTELGAAAFQLLDSERVEVRLCGDRLEKRMAHWRGVVISACEQCGRVRVPEVGVPVTVPEWLAQPFEGLRLVLDPAGDMPLRAASAGDRITLAVGPEGGFSDGETSLMRKHGVQVARLGPRVLRTETAGPAAVAVLQAVAGDLG